MSKTQAQGRYPKHLIVSCYVNIDHIGISNKDGKRRFNITMDATPCAPTHCRIVMDDGEEVELAISMPEGEHVNLRVEALPQRVEAADETT